MSIASAINDLLNLLHEEWLPEDRKDIIKQLLIDMIDKMEDNMSMDDLRWLWVKRTWRVSYA